MKAITIKITAVLITMAVPLIMVILLLKGYYSLDLMMDLGTISVIPTTLGIILYFTSEKLK